MPTLAELYRALKGYAKDALPGGGLNAELTPQAVLDGAAIASTPVPVVGDLIGFGADLHRYAKEPETRTIGNFALSGLGMLPFVPGMTAWHGSPHKFDKFSLDKIGTGEGAQAYGHGLYLAESPQVAKDYAGALSAARSNKPVGNVDLQQVYQGLPNDVPDSLLAARRDFRALNESGELSAADRRDFLEAVKGNITASRGGNLYKTDIPDEAVARFLDWDKPLSQQATEVRKALSGINDEILSSWKAQPAGSGFDLMQGVNAYDALARGRHSNPAGNVAAAEKLKAAGIPGIRYLDGGSRGAGSGTSNFVAFDPDMIRILERNGQPTGQKPWGLGEWLQRMQQQN